MSGETFTTGVQLTKDLVDEVLKAFYELKRQRAQQPPHVYMGGKIALSIKKNYPDVWKDFISTLRQKGARLFLQWEMGELPREYNIWGDTDG